MRLIQIGEVTARGKEMKNHAAGGIDAELGSFLNQLAERGRCLADSERAMLEQAARRLEVLSAKLSAGLGDEREKVGAIGLPRQREDVAAFLGGHYLAMRIGDDQEFWLRASDLVAAIERRMVDGSCDSGGCEGASGSGVISLEEARRKFG